MALFPELCRTRAELSVFFPNRAWSICLPPGNRYWRGGKNKIHGRGVRGLGSALHGSVWEGEGEEGRRAMGWLWVPLTGLRVAVPTHSQAHRVSLFKNKNIASKSKRLTNRKDFHWETPRKVEISWAISKEFLNWSYLWPAWLDF